MLFQWTGSSLVQVWLIACSIPSHYRNQFPELIVNWIFKNKLMWNSNINLMIFIQENYIENVICKMLVILFRPPYVNSSPLSATYMHQWIGSSLVKVMASRLFGAKPLPEPMLDYCQLDSWEQVSVKFESEFDHFHSRKCIWKCSLLKWQPYCPGGDELKTF